MTRLWNGPSCANQLRRIQYFIDCFVNWNMHHCLRHWIFFPSDVWCSFSKHVFSMHALKCFFPSCEPLRSVACASVGSSHLHLVAGLLCGRLLVTGWIETNAVFVTWRPVIHCQSYLCKRRNRLITISRWCARRYWLTLKL